MTSFSSWLGALGSAVSAGVFYAFSTFVMRGLARLPLAQGVAAMQAINVAAIGPWLLGLLFGTGAVCLVIAIQALKELAAPQAQLRLAGAVLFLIGAIVVTAAFNVPRNDALSVLQPESPEAARYFPEYLRDWTRYNHVRTALCLAASALLLLSLSQPAPATQVSAAESRR